MTCIRRCIMLAALAVTLPVRPVPAHWESVLRDSLESPSVGEWTYMGATNGLGQPLAQVDPVQERIRVEWDQVNRIVTNSDPYVIVPSRLLRPLARPLTDRDSFRFGATVMIEPGSVNNTDQGHQIANFGLYDPSQMGPDRCSADWDSTNTVRVKDGSDYVEFNYFVGNAWSGPNICAAIGPHNASATADNFPVWWGPSDAEWPRNYCGFDHWLPEGTNLFVEVFYHGAETGLVSRRAYAAIYTDPSRTNLLMVNGRSMEWWTPPLAESERFHVTHFGVYNHVNKTGSDPFWGPFGPPAHGTGTLDDVYAEWRVEPGEIFTSWRAGDSVVVNWASVSGATYRVLMATNLAGAGWVTSAVVQAAGESSAVTNSLLPGGGYYRVE